MIDSRFSLISIDGAKEGQADALFAQYTTDKYCYRLLKVTHEAAASWYLYATSKDEGECSDIISYVLGVFDTCGQLSYFLDLHLEHELKVPALQITGLINQVYYDDNGVLVFPEYAGVYRVGFKSYTVDIDEMQRDKRIVNYIQSYKTQYLGVFSEKDACIAIYSHFDQRLRGCKMC